MRFAVLALTVALAGCVSARTPPSASGPPPEVDPVQLAVLRYVMAGWSDDRPRYVCVHDADPPAALLEALQPWSPTPLLPCCTEPALALPAGFESPFLRFRITATLSRTPTSAVLQAGFLCGWQCAGLAEYHCVRDADGRWHVARVTNEEES